MPDGKLKTTVFRALVWKEWRQLRSLRLLGALLCAFLPLVLLAAAEAVRRRWLPFVDGSSYEVRDIVIDIAPRMMVVAWGVLALFVAAQVFVADHAAGTEMFLLASPVRRRWTLGARLVACAGSSAVIAACGAVAWCLWALPMAGMHAILSWEVLRWLIVVGPLATVISVVGGMAAAALVRSPLAAVLAGGMLAAIPILLASLLAGMFPLARIGRMSIGGVVPFLLIPVLAFSAFRMFCHGEPLGRGRLRRGTRVLAPAVVALAAIFVSAAAFAVRGGSHRQGMLYPSPTRALAVAVDEASSRRVWLVDTSSRTGEVVHDFGALFSLCSWSPDGRYLAVATQGGPLGMMRSAAVIEIFDLERRATLATVPVTDLGFDFPVSGTWAGSTLLVIGIREANDVRLGTVSAIDGEGFPTAFEPRPLKYMNDHWTLFGPGGDGRIYYAMTVNLPDNSDGLRVFEFDAATRSLAAQPVFEGAFYIPTVRFRWNRYLNDLLSPSGRFLIISQYESPTLRVAELPTGRTIEFDCSSNCQGQWLTGDTLIWADVEQDVHRLKAWHAEHAATRDLLTAAFPGNRFELEPSPDRSKLLVYESIPLGSPAPASRRDPIARIWDTVAGQWIEAPKDVLAPFEFWGGRDVLVNWSAEGHVYFPLNGASSGG